uniref:Eukaryotic translation initiation factor 3 subunit B n=1 Tax=Timspurckia oligopyrenoides TaxID=708627 RepID=A0A7S1EQF8_9RHOD
MVGVEMPVVSPNEYIDSDTLVHQEERFTQRLYDSILVVDNIPIVGEEKLDRLRTTLSKIFKAFGKLIPWKNPITNSSDLLLIPFDQEKNISKGFCFVKYSNPDDALKACATDGYPLDKNHTFITKLLSDIIRVQFVSDSYSKPDRPSSLVSCAEDVVDLYFWLSDNRSREQFCIRYQDSTEIFWYDSILQPDLDYSRDHWTESKIMWSPKGSYLATFHRQGVALWGGEKWEKIARFAHDSVKFAEFSPCERYLITFNSLSVEQDDAKNPTAVKVWEISTGRILRSFLGLSSSNSSAGNAQLNWPFFKWSHDGAFLARKGPGVISVYETPGLGLVGKKSLKIDKVQEFEWSPSANMLALWTPEVGDTPARVSLVEFPSKSEVRSKALFSVSHIGILWHPQGKYLCCQVDRLTKSKKGKFVNFELFRITAKNIPVETVEFKESDSILEFKWEPKGDRFAVLKNDTPGRQAIVFYTMDAAATSSGESASSVGVMKELFTIGKKTVSHLFWSPSGNIIVLAGLGALNGQLEWINVNEQISLNTNEHFMATEIQWDSSGRYLSTSVSMQRSSGGTGFKIWSCIGRELVDQNRDALFQFLWRPRPVVLLSQEQQKYVKKNLKEFRARYEQEDQELKESRKSGQAAKRRAIREEWEEYMKGRMQEYESEKALRVKARGGIDDDHVWIPKVKESEGYVVIEEVKETVVEVKAQVDKSRGKLINSDDDRD